MSDGVQVQDNMERAVLEQAQAELAKILGHMPNDIPLLLFATPLRNDIFSDAARKVIRAVRQLAPRVSLREYDLSHEMANKWNAEYSPSLLFDPEHYNIRWLGAPIGEETMTFVEILKMVGYRTSDISEASLNVLEKIDSPRSIKIFVSPTCPYCPQQVVNASKAVLEKPEMISLEIIDIQANPELADKYSAQSVPQTFVNDELISLGAQPEELFMSSLQKMEQQTVFIPESDAAEVDADLVIIGGGPAGLTAGIYSARSGLRTVIIERGTLGGQVAMTPMVENYPGFTQVGGKALVDIMVSHALEYTQIFQGEEAMEIRTGDPLVISTNRRKFKTKAVLLATGASHSNLDVKGELRLSGSGVSYCSTCDGPLFKGKKVVMVGGGDSAVTEALNLHHIGVEVSLIHRRDTLRAQEYLTNSLYANKIPILFNTEVKEIQGEKRVEGVVLYNSMEKKETTMSVDGVFIAIGYKPAVDLAKKSGVEITPEGYIKRDDRHRTNIPGIYSAGDVEGGYKQIVTAAGQGSEAAISIFEDQINPYWKRETA
jgi:thioredoxin reductase (NADPH)